MLLAKGNMLNRHNKNAELLLLIFHHCHNHRLFTVDFITFQILLKGIFTCTLIVDLFVVSESTYFFVSK